MSETDSRMQSAVLDVRNLAEAIDYQEVCPGTHGPLKTGK